MGPRIQAAREAAGLTQVELGARCGVRQQIVARWEAGESNPKLHHLVALAETLRLTTDQLLGIQPMPAGTVNVEAAINRDPDITPEARKALLRAYRAARGLPGASS